MSLRAEEAEQAAYNAHKRLYEAIVSAFMAPISARVRKEAQIAVATAWGMDDPADAKHAIAAHQLACHGRRRCCSTRAPRGTGNADPPDARVPSSRYRQLLTGLRGARLAPRHVASSERCACRLPALVERTKFGSMRPITNTIDSMPANTAASATRNASSNEYIAATTKPVSAGATARITPSLSCQLTWYRLISIPVPTGNAHCESLEKR
ncbi:hypothetical protein QCE47_16665 [Caballeronia sp. LZ025]|uniref:hypothetical protein n=1 Tax=Caballeronia sp. LZ025 TaxID=3038562 RepID=UPI0028590A73|nr:hypothetical protein [Caballeronia sp. LZ025]MDR5733952.1 hypothetical protein [Caballeronia sp. LZ025]